MRHSMLAIVLLAAAPARAGDVISFIMTVDGTQETPSVTTAATGVGTAELNTATNQLSWAVPCWGWAVTSWGELYVLGNTTGVPFGDTGVVLRIAPKVGDLDGDGITGISDFLILLAQFGQSGVAADLDMDGIVGITDFLILLANWG